MVIEMIETTQLSHMPVFLSFALSFYQVLAETDFSDTTELSHMPIFLSFTQFRFPHLKGTSLFKVRG